MTQTEQLRGELKRILECIEDLSKSGILINAYSTQILKACKEAGLLFADYSTDDEGTIIQQGLEEIEI